MRAVAERSVQVSFAYSLAPHEAPTCADARPALHHPLPAMLEALRESGSIKRAAASLGLSYRHVWGELRRWEADLGRPLIHKTKGQRTRLTPFGERLLGQEREIQARYTAQLERLREELERAFHGG